MLSRALAAAAALAAFSAHAQQSIILVRHADLADAAGLDAKAVPLSSAGQARAEQLAKMVERSGATAVYATDYARTRVTAEPSARMLKREVTVASQDDPKEFVSRLRRDHADQVVLVVGHGDTLPGILKALGVSGDVRIDRQDYGNIFIVTPREGSAPALVHLRY